MRFTKRSDKFEDAVFLKYTFLNMNLSNINYFIMAKYTNPYSISFSNGYTSQKVAINNIPDGYIPLAVLGLSFASSFFTMVGDGAITDNNTSFWMSARHIVDEGYSGNVQITALILYVKKSLL